MVDLAPLWPPWLVAEALGKKAIPAKLSAILAAHFRTVRKDGVARSSEKRLGRGIHSFLTQLALGVNLITGLERVSLVGVTLTEWCISCTCYSPSGSTYTWPSKVSLPAWVSCPLRASPRWWRPPWRPLRRGAPFAPCRDWITPLALWGISTPDCHTGPCKRAGKTAGADHLDFALEGRLLPPRTKWIGYLVWRRTDLSTSSLPPRVFSR